LIGKISTEKKSTHSSEVKYQIIPYELDEWKIQIIRGSDVPISLLRFPSLDEAKRWIDTLVHNEHERQEKLRLIRERQKNTPPLDYP
jgi:hypothetical protein